jgi:hypothetical protein
MSKGVFWILFAGVAALIIFKVVHFVRNVNKMHDIEVEENKYNNAGSYIIITDSGGKKDTQIIQDYIENYNPAADTIKKLSPKDRIKQ